MMMKLRSYRKKLTARLQGDANWFLVLTLVVSWVLAVVWFARWSFSYQADYQFLEYWFNHSQWRLPESPWKMGDAPLYEYSGWFLVKGGSLFTVTAEVPPLGLYLIGFFLELFANAYLLNWLYLGVASFIFLKLASLWWPRSKSLPLLALGLLLTLPVVFEQLTTVMLDLPQLVWLLLHAWWWLKWQQNKQFWWLVGSGLALGLMAATKIGFFPVAILTMELASWWWHYLKKRSISSRELNQILNNSFLIIISLLLGYLLIFMPFILQEGLATWLKNQVWVVKFYLNGSLGTNRLMPLITTLTGWFEGWWGSGWQWSQQWTWLLPVALGIQLLSHKKNKEFNLNTPGNYIYWVTLVMFLSFLLIPWWPRFWLLWVPGAVLLLVDYAKNHQRVLLIIFILSMVWSGRLLLQPFSSSSQQWLEHWQLGSYASAYQMLEPASVDLNWSDWNERLLQNRLQMQAYKVEAWIEGANDNPFVNQQQVILHTSYQTPLGVYEYQHPLRWQRKDNRWQAIWDWELVLEDFDPRLSQVETKISYQPADQPTGDSHVGNDCEYGEGYFIWANVVDLLQSGQPLDVLATWTVLNQQQILDQIWQIAPSSHDIPVAAVHPDKQASAAAQLGPFLESRGGKLRTRLLPKNCSSLVNTKLYTEILNNMDAQGQIIHFQGGQETILLVR